MNARTRILLGGTLALFAAGCGGVAKTDLMLAPDPASLAEASVAEISDGGEVDVEAYLVDGKRTVVEFGAVW